MKSDCKFRFISVTNNKILNENKVLHFSKAAQKISFLPLLITKIFSDFITANLNNSVSTSIISDSVKLAYIKPVFKEGKYTPVSKLSKNLKDTKNMYISWFTM